MKKQKIKKKNKLRTDFKPIEYVNKRAFFDYEILEKIETGIALLGNEIKKIREGKVNLNYSFGKIFQGKKSPELFVLGINIEEAAEPQRTRKLLAHRTQINHLLGQTKQKGLTLVPLKLYFKKGKAKILLGIGKGRKKYDKRQFLKQRELSREVNNF